MEQYKTEKKKRLHIRGEKYVRMQDVRVGGTKNHAPFKGWKIVEGGS
jgi:hypothetical protein